MKLKKKYNKSQYILLQYSTYCKIFKIAIILYCGLRIVILQGFMVIQNFPIKTFPVFLWLLICLINKWLNRKPLLPLNPHSTARTVNFDKQLKWQLQRTIYSFFMPICLMVLATNKWQRQHCSPVQGNASVNEGC